MQIVQLLTIAKTVWLERARRRPHTAIAWFMCMIVAATVGACALFGASPFAEPTIALRVGRCIFVLASGASLTYLCEWLLGLHFHGTASVLARGFWHWRGFGDTARRSLPRGHLALIIFAAVGAWAQPRMITVLISMLVVYCVGLYIVLHQLALSQYHRKVHAKFNREIAASTCDIIMTPLLASVSFLMGNIIILAIALAPALALLYWSGERLAVLRALREPSPLQIASIIRRLVPGIAVLLVDGILHIISTATLHANAVNADPWIAVLVASILFTLAGLCAARRFEPAGTGLAGLFILPPRFHVTVGRAAGATTIALGSAVLISALVGQFLSQIPVLNVLGFVIAIIADFAAVLFAVLVNTEQYAGLCDPPNTITLPG